MQTLAVGIHKGGVGKTTITTQFAYYLASKNLRVLVLDFDHQMNTTKTLGLSGKALISSVSTLDVFTKGVTTVESGEFVVVPGAKELKYLEREGRPAHNTYLANLHKFLAAVAEKFDVCLIDTNGAPDIRLTSAMVVAGYVISPIELAQPSIEGIRDMLEEVKLVRRLNPTLQHIGLFINMVESKPLQKGFFAQIVSEHSGMLIRGPGGPNDFAHIPNRSVFPEAEAVGIPVWEIKKTAARDAWRELEPYFLVIARKIGLEI